MNMMVQKVVNSTGPVAAQVTELSVHEPGWERIAAPRGNDPIQAFLDAGVSFRRLLWHGLVDLDWLTHQSDKKLRICYRNDAGEIVSEKVTRVGLLKRAEELGWSPWPADSLREWEADTIVLGFVHATPYRDGRGNCWWSSECDDDTCAPLCFPEKKLERLRAESERRSKRRHLKLEREQAEKRKAQLRENDRNYRVALEHEIDREMEKAVKRGKPIKRSTARRRVLAFFKDIADKMERRNTLRLVNELENCLRKDLSSQGGEQ